MATITDTTWLQFALHKVNHAKQRRTTSQPLAMNRVGAWLAALVRLMLTLAGFGFLTWGMFTWDIIAGLITAGLSCFVLSWLAKPDAVSQTDNRQSELPQTDQYLAERGYS